MACPPDTAEKPKPTQPAAPATPAAAIGQPLTGHGGRPATGSHELEVSHPPARRTGRTVCGGSTGPRVVVVGGPGWCIVPIPRRWPPFLIITTTAPTDQGQPSRVPASTFFPTNHPPRSTTINPTASPSPGLVVAPSPVCLDRFNRRIGRPWPFFSPNVVGAFAAFSPLLRSDDSASENPSPPTLRRLSAFATPAIVRTEGTHAIASRP